MIYLLGEGEERPKLEQYIREHRLEENVKILGFQENPYPYIKNSAATVLTSLSEGFSLVLVESVMLNAPIISTDVGVAKELTAKYDCGELIRYDEKELASVLIRYLNRYEGYRVPVFSIGNEYDLKTEKHAKGIFMAAHNQRHSLVHRKAKEWIESGKMGKVISFRCTLAHPGPERYGFARNKNTWYMSAANRMGCVTDLGIHKCDAMQYILGEKFTKVSAYAGTLQKTDESGKLIPAYDNAVAILQTESGIIGTLNLSYTNYSKMDNSTIYYCEKGVLRCQFYDDCVLEVELDGAETVRYFNPQVPHVNSGVIEAFIDAIATGKPSPVPAADALRSIRVCFAIDESSRTHRIVEL